MTFFNSSIWTSLQPALAAVSAVTLTLSGITGFSYWIFRTFASKWLDNKFATDLEKMRHTSQLELQKLKVQIDALLDRAIKLNDKEFEILPEAWRLLDIAFSDTEDLESRFYRGADLNSMSEETLALFLKNAALPDLHKHEIQTAIDKTDIFIKALKQKKLTDAESSRVEFYNYIMGHGIFLQPKFAEAFLELHDMIALAFAETQSAIDLANILGPKSRDKLNALKTEGKKNLSKLRSETNQRLWSSSHIVMGDH